MNYTPGKLFADCTHRCQVTATPRPQPEHAAQEATTEQSTFLLNLIETRLLPTLAPFPEAFAAYSETLRVLLARYAAALPGLPCTDSR